MKAERDESKAVIFSQWMFERLLIVYPKAHRQEYGPTMAQLFRDQCCDAWSTVGWRGLAALWLRVLPDLVKASLAEHVGARKSRKCMNSKRIAFLAVSVPMLLLLVTTSIIATFISPEPNTVSIKVQRDASDISTSSASQPSKSGICYPRRTQRKQIELIDGKVL